MLTTVQFVNQRCPPTPVLIHQIETSDRRRCDILVGIVHQMSDTYPANMEGRHVLLVYQLLALRSVSRPLLQIFTHLAKQAYRSLNLYGLYILMYRIQLYCLIAL
ncbi:unnamed protein product [Schistosoma bovis]|nr:unnamed protein product [Schistosoma bovis]